MPFETSKPTTHADPTYVVDGVVHYCVANMPGAVPRTSTYALNNVTLPHVLAHTDSAPTPPVHVNPALASTAHVAEHPSPAAVFPSSQFSTAERSPLPHAVLHTLSAPSAVVHVHPALDSIA